MSLIVWKLQKKKEDVRCMLYQVTQIFFNDGNPALCHEQHDKKRHQNDGETSTLLVLSYYYLAPVTKVLLQAHHGICCYVYIFAILTYVTTVNQCLTIFFSKSYVSLERSTSDEVKKSIKPLKKWECQKCQRLIHFFSK